MISTLSWQPSFLRDCIRPLFQFLRDCASGPMFQFLKDSVSGPTFQFLRGRMFQFCFYIYSLTRKLLMTNAFIQTCRCLFVFYVLCVVIREVVSRYLNGKYNWIDRELSLLEGSLSDIEKMSSSEVKKTKKAHQIFDPDLIHGEVSVRVLNGWEESWRTQAAEVCYEAGNCFYEIKTGRWSNLYTPESLLLATFDLVPMVRAALRIHRLHQFLGKNEIDVDLGTSDIASLLRKKKIGASDIYRSLEQSRSRVRSLQTSVGKIKPQSGSGNYHFELWRNNRTMIADPVISSLEKLITVNPDLIGGIDHQIQSFMMHVKLLNAFVEDLKQLNVLETEMEMCWVREADKTITASKHVIESIDTIANKKKRWWLPKFSTFWARRKLKEDIMRVGTEISALQESKARYGFRFVKPDSPKSAHQSPQNPASHHQTTELSASVNQIHSWLNQLQGTNTNEAVVSQVSSIRKELEHMHKLFKERMATEDHATELRNACLKQLKKTAAEAQNLSEFHLHRIMDAVNLLQRCLRLYSIEARVESQMSVVGLEEDVHKLILRLTTEGDSFISIVGMDGIGKTTLARKVFTHSTTENHFAAVRRWVSIPQNVTDENKVLESVGNQVLNTKEKDNGKDHWIKKVQDFLKERVFLIVFDDVSSNDIMSTLRETFSVMVTNGSKIVFITHDQAIASKAVQDKSLHQLRLRTRRESWEIFTQMVDCPPQMETLAKKVVERTGGLPLAILHLGCRMSSGKKMTFEKLARELENMIQGQNKIRWSKILSVNDDQLQPHKILSKCISYFQHFAGDIELPARRIVASWVAQGFVEQGEDEERTPESTAYDKLKELIGRNIIQVVQRKANGKVKTCCLPPCVQEYVLLEDKGKSKGNGTNVSSSLSTSTSLGRKLALHFNDKGVSFHHIQELNNTSQDVMINESYHEPVLIFDTGEGNKLREEGEFLRRGIAAGFFRQLQVLDLERVFRPHLPKIIGELKLLAYLGLRWTYVATIPSSVGNLVNLLTLDLKHTHVRTLPSSIWKLKKLRHLYLNQICGIEFMPLPTAISIRSLQTLSGMFVDKRNLVKGRLDKLISLRKLALAFQLEPTEQKVLEKWIFKLTNLRSLKLQSVNENGEPQFLSMSEAIFNLKELHSLYLFGKIEFISRLPENLTHLTLEASGLEKDPMSVLGKLPKLKFLSLNSGSYPGENMICSTNDFPLLFVLKLWNLDTLRKLNVQEGAMQNLREIEIKSCNDLAITGLQHLKNLHKHTVNGYAYEIHR